MAFTSTISSLYFVTCAIGGICNEQRSVDFIEITKHAPAYSCETFKQARPITPTFADMAKAEGYKVSLRCDSNNETKIAVTDSIMEAWLTSCGPNKTCTTDKLAMFNTPDSALGECESAETVVAPTFINERKKAGYTKFSYNCFPAVEPE